MSSRPIVVLDPGHGGDAPAGASSPNRGVGDNGLQEKDVALELARRARQRLVGDHTVVLTRDGDTNLALTDRAAVARNLQAGAFVSIHLSGADDPAVDRTDAVVARGGNERRRQLAGALQRRLSSVTGAPGVVLEADLGVIAADRHDPGTAACLAEVASLTNPAQARRLADPAYLDALADALAAAIREGLNGGGPAPLAYARGLTDTPAGAARAEADAAVARGDVDRATADAFLRSLFGEPTQTVEAMSLAAVPRQLDGETRVARPSPTMLEGFQSAAIMAALAAVPVPGSFLVPTALLELANRFGVTIGVGPAVTGAAVVGGSLGVGVVFAPGHRVGLFGSVAAVGGWIASVSATVQVTVVHGGPAVFGGESVGMGGGGGEGIVGSVTVLLDPNTRDFQGVTAAVGIGAGITPIEGLIQYQWTATTLAGGLGVGAARALESGVRTVKVWLNAFIPGNVPNITTPRPNHPGESMVPGLWAVGDCFSTDNRDFSSHIHASSRMHSEIELDVASDPPVTLAEWHHCDETHEYDCEDGDVEGTARAATGRMHFANVRGSAAGLIHVDLTAAAANPLVTGAPDIDYSGTVTIDVGKREVTFNGMVDGFPAFEMYATANGGAGVPLFRVPPIPGSDPRTNLFGAAARAVSGTATI